MEQEVKAVYIHLPFCKSICYYCDFCKVYYEEKLVDSYLFALQQEIKERYQKEKLQSIYIGGGTPSILSTKQWEYLFGILSLLNKDEVCEFTVEANTDSLTAEKIKLWSQNGVNRVSLGVETLHKNYQQAMGRVVDEKQVRNVVALLKAAGISNINVDLMYGFQNETVEEVEVDLSFLLSLDVPHISCYSLILEDHTTLKVQNYQRLSDEKDEQLYQKIEEILCKHGYCHYEISNYAKPGFFAQHNLVYWNNEQYYGFGCAAASYLFHVRSCNTRSITNYIKGKREVEKEMLTKKDEMDYEIILGLRKESGVNQDHFLKKYQCSIDSVYHSSRLQKQGVLQEKDGYLMVTRPYRYVLNEVLVQMLSE